MYLLFDYSQVIYVIIPTWSTISVGIAYETIGTRALGLVVYDPTRGKPCTWVMHNARVNAFPVLTGIERGAILISLTPTHNLRRCGWQVS